MAKKSPTLFLVFGILIALAFLGFYFGILGTGVTCTGGLEVLSLSQAQFTEAPPGGLPAGEYYILTLTAPSSGSGTECIRADFNRDQINSLLDNSNAGVHITSTKQLTVKIDEIEKEFRSVPLNNAPGGSFGTLHSFPSATIVNPFATPQGTCPGLCSSGTAVTDTFFIYDPTGATNLPRCACVYTQVEGQAGAFSQTVINRMRVTFALEGANSNDQESYQNTENIASTSVQFSQPGQYVNINNENKAWITWEGNLVSNVEFATLATSLQPWKFGNTWKYGAPNFKTDLAQSKQQAIDFIVSNRASTAGGSETGGGSTSNVNLFSRMSQYNSEVSTLSNDRLSSGTGNAITNANPSIEFIQKEGDKVKVFFDPSINIIPIFKIILNAEYIGIVHLGGQPEITCQSEVEHNSGIPKEGSGTVKNIGTGQGVFTVQANCVGQAINVNFPNPSLATQGIGTYTYSISVTTTGNDITTRTCTFTASGGTGNSDSCTTTERIIPTPSATCAVEGQTTCDGTKLLTCNNGQYIQQQCPEQCTFNAQNIAVCSGTQIAQPITTPEKCPKLKVPGTFGLLKVPDLQCKIENSKVFILLISLIGLAFSGILYLTLIKKFGKGDTTQNILQAIIAVIIGSTIAYLLFITFVPVLLVSILGLIIYLIILRFLP